MAEVSFPTRLRTDPVYEELAEMEKTELETLWKINPQIRDLFMRERAAVLHVSATVITKTDEILSRYSLLEPTGALFEHLRKQEESMRKEAVRYKKTAGGLKDRIKDADAEIKDTEEFFANTKDDLLEEKQRWSLVYGDRTKDELRTILLGDAIKIFESEVSLIGERGRRAVSLDFLAYLDHIARVLYPKTDDLIDAIMVTVIKHERNEKVRSRIVMDFAEDFLKRAPPMSRFPPIHMALVVIRR